MKKIFSYITLSILLLFAVARAADFQPYVFPMTGKWQPSGQSIMSGDFSLQDVQNLRKDGAAWVGVKGHTKINTTLLSSYPYLINGFHFKKDFPAESHVLVVGADAASATGSKVYENTTAIPSAGDFSSTVLHTDATGGIGKGRFSKSPAGTMVYANGPETKIWGGTESPIINFLTLGAALTGSSVSLTTPSDYSDVVINTRTDQGQVAVIGGGGSAHAMLHFDGTDTSTTITGSETLGGAAPKTWSASGNAQLDTAQFKFGSASLLLDGTGDYVSVASGDADINDFYMADGDFTVDFWMKRNTNDNGGMFGQYVDASNYVTLYCSSSGTTTITYTWKFVINGTTVIDGTSTNTSADPWQHVALTRSGATTYLFVNGALVDTGTSETWGDLNAAFTVGRAKYSGSDEDYKGWIDEFRVIKGACKWSAAFTVPSKAYSVGNLSWIIGVPRPAQGFKFYVATPNLTSSTMTGAEWNGASWSALTITDNTDTGASLAQTGTVTFASTVNTAQPRYINDASLYWYQFTIDAGDATIYYVTADLPWQNPTNIWSGQYGKPGKFLKWYSSAWSDYSDNVIDGSTSTYAEIYIAALPDNYMVVGFTTPQQAIKFTVATTEKNTAAGVMTIYYWDGAAWVAVTGLNDGTSTGGITLAKTGVVSWQALPEGTEQQTTAQDETPLYYYKIGSSGTIGYGVSNMRIYEVRGVEAPKSIPSFELSEIFQNRLFLLNEYAGEKNKLWYSSFNAPHIMNGTDSGFLYIGDNAEITAATALFNVFKAGSYEQLIIAKAHEIYRLAGDGPSTWTSYRINANVGCVAPLSMVSAEVTEGMEDGVKRQVAIFQGADGFYVTDGAAVIPISEDIRCYFDSNDSRAIPASMKSKTQAWFDPSLGVYKALIASGSTATYLNTELEYDLATREWTKLYRVDGTGANPLQSGFSVYDTAGAAYTYGGNTKGNLYRLENGYHFDSTAIAQYLWTKDFIPDAQAPVLRKSTIKNFRAMAKKQTGTMTVTHYGDGTATVDGTNNQSTIDSINLNTAPYDSQSCLLGPFLYHSFKFATSTSTNTGMELSGFGFWHEPFTTWR